MLGYDILDFSTLYICFLSAWSCGAKGVNLHRGKSILVISFIVTIFSIAFFHFFLQLKFFPIKKRKKYILYSMHWYFKSNQSHFLLFLSLWLVNSEKEVQFECSDDGEDLYLTDFSYGETFTPRNQTVAFSFVNILQEAARLYSTILWILSLQLLYELFCSSFKQDFFFFFYLGTYKTKQKVDVTLANAAVLGK